ncbi:SCO0930 family lipoprotein [Streptomyces sp. NPDC003077]|uniref:SCO0930 family lipoprotein n=1 Tax=Streptomyces sp. NPDC003077 TaxID=3154443 RepID=UPI0033A505E9
MNPRPNPTPPPATLTTTSTPNRSTPTPTSHRPPTPPSQPCPCHPPRPPHPQTDRPPARRRPHPDRHRVAVTVVAAAVLALSAACGKGGSTSYDSSAYGKAGADSARSAAGAPGDAYGAKDGAGGAAKDQKGQGAQADAANGYGAGSAGQGSAAPSGGDGYGSGADSPAPGPGMGRGAAGTLALRQVGGLGPVVTDGKGRTLYRFERDTAQPPASACTGGCAAAWPPVPAEGAGPATGMAAGALGSVRRPDGVEQLTLGGRPVYRYAKDTAPGDAKGQGVGGAWYALTADGGKADGKADGGAGGNTADGYGGAEGASGNAAGNAAGLAVREQPRLGRILVDGKARTLYRFDKDSAWPMRIGCVGACLDTWKPARPVDRAKLSGVAAKLVGTVKRPDGSRQLSIACWPVYWFTGDKQPGDIKGQGKGGVWFAVSATGKKITDPASP